MNWLALPLILSTMACAHAGTKLQLYTEELPPFNYLAEDGETVTGSATQKVRTALQKLGISHQITLTDWARAYNLARTQANSCVYSTARLPERESLFKWAGPIAVSEWALWGRKGGIPPKTLEDAAPARTCDIYGDAVASYLQARNFKLILSQSHQVCVQNLIRGQVDYWATGRDSGLEMVNRLGLHNELVVMLTFQRTEMYLACHPSLPDKLMQDIQEALGKAP